MYGAAAVGVNVPQYPFVSQQMLGAYLGILVIALWLARKHLRTVMQVIVGSRRGTDDSTEPMRYRTAALALFWESPFWLDLLLFGNVGIVCAGVLFDLLSNSFRVYADARGVGTTGSWHSHFGPFQLIVSIVGSRRIPVQTLVTSAPHWTHTKGFQSQPCSLYWRVSSWRINPDSTHAIFESLSACNVCVRHRDVLGISGS